MKELNIERYYTEFAYACAKVMDKDCSKYFKRFDPELPRIIKALGALKSIRPDSILDVGSGRGRALWPIVHNFPNAEICCVDLVEWRCEVINAVHSGGINRVKAFCEDISGTTLGANSFDVVTALEVIEHIQDAAAAMTAIFRASRQYIVASVPSKPDNNPGHVHFFSSEAFEKLLNIAEMRSGKKIGRITFDYVRNSMTIFIRLEK